MRRPEPTLPCAATVLAAAFPASGRDRCADAAVLRWTARGRSSMLRERPRGRTARKDGPLVLPQTADPSDGLESVARYLRDTRSLTSPAAVADVTVQHVRDVVGAAWAEVVETRTDGRLAVLASSDRQLSRDLMRAREEAGGPPDPSGDLDEQTVVLDDLADGRWWPAFAELATERTGVRGAVLAYVAVPGRGSAVLAVSDPRPGWFSDGRDRYPRVLADLAAAVLARAGWADDAHHLRRALASNRRIATAVGVVAARGGLDPDAAFTLLRLASQRRNEKLAVVADEVLAGGDPTTVA